MLLDNLFKNLIYDPVSVLGLIVFYVLLVNLPLSLVAVFKKKSSSAVRLITILVNLLIHYNYFLGGQFLGIFLLAICMNLFIPLRGGSQLDNY